MTGRGIELRKRFLAVMVCFAMLAVMLGIGASGGRKADHAIGIGRGEVMNEFVRVRKAPSTSAEIAAVLRGGQEVTILGVENGFYQIIAEIAGDGEKPGETVEGYMKMDLIYKVTYFLKKDEK